MGADQVGWVGAAGRLAAGVAMLAAGASSMAGQERVELGPPDAVAAEGFTSIFAIEELDDGRVLLTDSREPAVAIVDLDAGSAERIGRRGEGPGEYLRAFSIVHFDDGSFGVYDTGNSRFLAVSDDGRVVGTRPLRRPDRSGMAPPRVWHAGRAFLVLRTVDLDRGRLREEEVLRWDPATGAVEELGVIMGYAEGQEGRGIVPMPRGDAWSALPDGSWARISQDPYRVEWHGGTDGGVVGPPLEHRRMRVGDAERDAWTREMLARPAGAASMTGGGEERSVSDSDVRQYRSRIDDSRFPEYVPVFEPGYVPAAPWSELWIRLEVESGPARTVFDIIDRRGHRVRQVAVDGQVRLAGFGRNSVYLVRVSELGLEWLERYARLP